jgi:hypothetical protein
MPVSFPAATTMVAAAQGCDRRAFLVSVVVALFSAKSRHRFLSSLDCCLRWRATVALQELSADQLPPPLVWQELRPVWSSSLALFVLALSCWSFGVVGAFLLSARPASSRKSRAVHRACASGGSDFHFLRRGVASFNPAREFSVTPDASADSPDRTRFCPIGQNG